MRVRQVMSADVQCCTADTPIPAVAQMMVSGDCGAIPVVDERRHPIGVVTDRDIAMMAVARGQDARRMKARDCMTQPVLSVRGDSDLREAVSLMERKQVRRVAVVDEKGACCGILALADVARLGREQETAELVRDVSRPGAQAINH